MLQSKKLRVRVLRRSGNQNTVCAHFPGEEMDGKLFWNVTVEDATRYMYARRLRKQTNRTPWSNVE